MERKLNTTRSQSTSAGRSSLQSGQDHPSSSHSGTLLHQLPGDPWKRTAQHLQMLLASGRMRGPQSVQSWPYSQKSVLAPLQSPLGSAQYAEDGAPSSQKPSPITLPNTGWFGQSSLQAAWPAWESARPFMLLLSGVTSRFFESPRASAAAGDASVPRCGTGSGDASGWLKSISVLRSTKASMSKTRSGDAASTVANIVIDAQ